jgi:L-arabinose isomerase
MIYQKINVMEHKLKIGLFGIGLDTCWAQFDGLLEKLRSYQGMIKDRWSKAGPSHHCAIGTGYISSRISKLAELLDIGFLRIC